MGVNYSAPTQINSRISEFISETINETVLNCSAANTSVQKINISNLTLEGCGLEISDLSQSIDSNIDLTCVLKGENIKNITNDIGNKVESEIKKTTSGLTFSSNVDKSFVDNSIKEKIMNTIINKNIIDCSVKTANEQLIEINNIKVLNCPAIAPTVKISNLTQLLIINAVAKCSGDIINQEDIDNISKNVTSSINETITEGFTATGLIMISAVIGVIIFCISLTVILFKSGIIGGGSKVMPVQPIQSPMMPTYMNYPYPRY